MKKQFLFLSLLFIVAFFNSCQKEFSHENGGELSTGSLQSDTGGDCLPKTVVGTYEAGTAINGTANYIEVQVDVITPGSYTIYTDTLNGVYFRATGVFTTTGLTTIQLKGNGTPVASGINNYVVTYDASVCIIAVTTLPSGAGGPATMVLDGAPGTCMSYNLQGNYTSGVDLDGTNKVDIGVNVTTIGTYNISTTANNGMVFSGSGAVLNTGPQVITLAGNGQPSASGVTNITVTIGSSSCSFPINVTGPAVYTINCGSAVPNGTYTQNVALDGTNTVDIQVNVTTIGGYNITGSVSGMTFSATGNFPATGTVPVTLVGTGKPTASGTLSVPLTAGGAAACSFNVTVAPGSGPATTDWSFKEGATTFEGAFTDASLDVTTVPGVGTLTSLIYEGTTSTGEIMDFTLGDFAGGITNNETYSSGAAGTGNFLAFYYTGTGTAEYNADPSISGVTMTLKVTSHNTTTKTITGTFSGTVKNEANVTKTISAGTFTGTYQ